MTAFAKGKLHSDTSGLALNLFSQMPNSPSHHTLCDNLIYVQLFGPSKKITAATGKEHRHDLFVN